MANTYQVLTPGGALTQYGPVDVAQKFPSVVKTFGERKELLIDFSYDDLPTVSTTNNLVLAIPAYSVITAVMLQVITPFAGGTSYNIGLQTRAGVEIDNAGLYNGTVLADIDAIGDTPLANGALLPGWVSTGIAETIRPTFADIGANDGQVVVVATGTFTAGRAKLWIEYQPLTEYQAQ